MTTSRFAPSPTGRLHLGHAFSAAVGRRAAGTWRLRMEDLDPGRSRPEFVDGIHQDLEWLGLERDGDVIVQSTRAPFYDAALRRLRDEGLAYACFCTRADIAAAAAPHDDGAPHYPGTCRSLRDDPRRREREPHAWRLDTRKAIARVGLPGWQEHDGRMFESKPEDVDDIILARKDAMSAYHLACVIDDAAQGVDLVVRGTDLRSSTPVQRLLQVLLDLPEPAYLHHPLVVHDDGRRLAKRDRAPTLAAMRDKGVDGRELAADLAESRLPLGFRLANP